MAWETTTSNSLRALRLESIRSKLLVFAVLATLIPSISTAWISYAHNKRSLNEKIAQELETVSSQAARELDLWLKERLYDLRIFASSYEVTENLDRQTRGGRTVSRLNEYFNSVRERFQDYEELLAVDMEGRVVATSAEKVVPVEMPAGWELDIQRDIAALGPPGRDSARGRTVMLVAVPIRLASTRLLGALAARLNLAAVDSILGHYSGGDSGRVYLITRKGQLVAGTRTQSPGVLRDSLPEATAKQLLDQEGAAIEFTSYDGRAAIGTLKKLGQLDLAVVGEISTAEAYRQIARMRNVTIMVVAGLLLVVGLLAYVLGLSIVRPVDRLARGAAEVAAGDLSVDLPVAGGGEVAYLTRVFNEMVTRLREGREELEQLSNTDGLTGLFNRRVLMDRLGNEVSRARRDQGQFAVLMADVDHFKAYNDTHGHLAGDQVLARVGALIRESGREVDCPARYGGEEFVVLLPSSDIEGAVQLAERMRTRLAAEDFPGGKITVSVGVCSYPECGDSPEAAIAAADAALYRAKDAGRDRIVRDEPGRASGASATADPPGSGKPSRSGRSRRSP